MVRPIRAAFADRTRRSANFAAAAPAPAWDRWTTEERLRFLNRLPRKLAKARLDELERGLGLNDDRQQ